MRDRTDTAASQKAPVVLGVVVDPFNATIEFYSDTKSVIVSPTRGDSPQLTPKGIELVLALRSPWLLVYISLHLRS